MNQMIARPIDRGSPIGPLFSPGAPYSGEGAVYAASLIAGQAVAPFDAQYSFRRPCTLKNQTNAPTIGRRSQSPVNPLTGAWRPSRLYIWPTSAGMTNQLTTLMT